MYIILIALLVISLILALRSMGDIQVPEEIQKMVRQNKHKGRIVFFKGKTAKHYSSSSSSSRSSG
ncbi:MAG: hypothetical protein WAV30_01910 [Microgenomates group bacterium]